MAAVGPIVEDENQVLILAEFVLPEGGNETLSASSVDEALAIIETDDRIDLLFTDLGLGEDSEGGLTIAGTLRRANRCRMALSRASTAACATNASTNTCSPTQGGAPASKNE